VFASINDASSDDIALSLGTYSQNRARERWLAT
jgi:hypothetical protein